MANELGVSFYFRNNRIRLRHQTIVGLGSPMYVRLKIDEKKKWMFILPSPKDKDAFRVFYTEKADPCESKNYINAANFLTYLANVVGVERNSVSLFFPGILLEEQQAVMIDLHQYEEIAYEVDYGR